MASKIKSSTSSAELTEGRRIGRLLNNFLLHFQPPRVHSETVRLTYTWGLGLITFSLSLILTVTGVLLMFYYVPSVDQAYGRMQDLATIVPYGRVVRNLHRWTAHAMVVAVFLHMLRVFYTGAYKAPRRINWIVGVGLLVLTLAFSFTGYLLPWDQLSYWAITISTSIMSYAPLIGEKLRYLLLGGFSVGQEALLRFYVLHVALLPLVSGILIGYHFWRVRKDGFLARSLAPRNSATRTSRTVLTFPRLLHIELLYFLGVLIVFLLVSLIFNAPLGQLANAEHPANPAKAPWYFLGLQELVSYSALWGGIILPGLLVVFLLLLPYIDRNTEGVGIWFARERWPIVLLVSLLMLAVVVFTIIGASFRGPNWNFYWLWQGWPGPN